MTHGAEANFLLPLGFNEKHWSSNVTPQQNLPNVKESRCGSGVLLSLAQFFATFPVQLKSRVFERVTSGIAHRLGITEGLVETNGGIANGLRLLCPARKHGFLFGHPGNYLPERATLRLAEFCAGRSRAFIDVGANEGLYTLSIALSRPYFAHPLHCFEPDPVLHARLAENVRRNRIAAVVHQAAVGSKSGSTRFYRNLSDDLSGSLTTDFATSHQVAEIEVRVVALAEFLKEHNLEHACVKVDAEGAGEAVWEGLAPEHNRVDWLIIEMLKPEIDGDLPRRIIHASGWNAYYIRDFDLVHSSYGEFEYQAPFYNWLFCRQAGADLEALVATAGFQVVANNRQVREPPRSGGRQADQISRRIR